MENALKNKQILSKYGNLFDKEYLIEKINLSLLGYYDINDSKNENENISYASVRGGCLPEINNELTLINAEIEEINELISKINNSPNSEEINFNNKNYTKIKLDLKPGNLDEIICQNFLNFNGISQYKILEYILKDELFPFQISSLKPDFSNIIKQDLKEEIINKEYEKNSLFRKIMILIEKNRSKWKERNDGYYSWASSGVCPQFYEDENSTYDKYFSYITEKPSSSPELQKYLSAFRTIGHYIAIAYKYYSYLCNKWGIQRIQNAINYYKAWGKSNNFNVEIINDIQKYTNYNLEKIKFDPHKNSILVFNAIMHSFFGKNNEHNIIITCDILGKEDPDLKAYINNLTKKNFLRLKNDMNMYMEGCDAWEIIKSLKEIVDNNLTDTKTPWERKDVYNNKLGIYKILISQPEKISNINEITSKNIFGENSAFFVKNDFDIEKLKSFNNVSIFETQTKNDLNPFLISLMSQNREVSNSLIDIISQKIINSSNESKYTPLHYACLYNYYELIESLIKKGAKINSKTRNNNYTPLDLLIIKGNYETLDLILNNLKNKEFINLIKEKNYFNITPFHYACLESIMEVKIMFKYKNTIKYEKGFTPEHYAFLGGRIDIYNYICNNDIKEFKEYINFLKQVEKNYSLTYWNDNNFDLDDFLKLLEKGNILYIRQFVDFYKNNYNLKKNLLENNSEKIIEKICIGRNPLILNLINEIFDLKNTMIAPLVGKFGLISFVEELKNMNIDILTEKGGKTILDYAIERKDEDMILQIFKNIEEISNNNLSKYLTHILMKSYKIFNSIYKYIISQEKFSKNTINFII